MKPKTRTRDSLTFDRDRFQAVERLASYEIVNFMLLAQIETQGLFGLRAEEHQVFLLIAVATVQRHVRGATADSTKVDRTPLGREESGAISRRRIAETLGIPLETVRRHVQKLLARGLVIEVGRGQIATPGGTLVRASTADATLTLARKQLALTNTLLRLGVFSYGTPPCETVPVVRPAGMPVASMPRPKDHP